MSTLQVLLLCIGGPALAAVILLAVVQLRFKQMISKPIPVEAGAPAEPWAEDVPLGRDDRPDLTLDLYGPEAVEGPVPLILFVPGDAPERMLKNAKRWAIFRCYADLAATRGYAAAVTDHRSSRNFKRAVAMVDDVKAALAVLQSNAADHGIDPERIVVWTFSGSAGAVLSRLLAEPVKGVRGLISTYGFLDLSTWPFRVPEEIAETYSLPPILNRLEALPYPVHILHVGRDRKMINTGFERSRDAVAAQGHPITTRVYENGRHGFEALEPPEEVGEEIERLFAVAEGFLAGG